MSQYIDKMIYEMALTQKYNKIKANRALFIEWSFDNVLAGYLKIAEELKEKSKHF
jgi:hypothetical protein